MTSRRTRPEEPGPRLPERVTKVELAVVQLQNCVAEVGDATLGSRRSEFAGGGREEDGLVHRARRTEADVVTVMSDMKELKRQIASLDHRIANGGIRRPLNPKERVTLIAAVIMAAGGVTAALVTNLG